MDRRLVLLAPEDNCIVVVRALAPGERVEVDGVAFVVDSTIAIGHKLARRMIEENEQVIKYGAVIGHASVAIAAGAHIHNHNLVSDYIPTQVPAGGSPTATVLA